MTVLRKVLLVSALSLALAASVSPVAQGAPSPAPDLSKALSVGIGNPGPLYRDQRQIPKVDQAKIKLAVKIIHNSVDRRSRVLDYRYADKNDENKVWERRRTVAGWMMGGGKVAHISQAELKRVKAVIARGDAYAEIRAQSGELRCRGKSGVHFYGKWMDMKIWLDSCETARMIFIGTVVAIAVGTILSAVFATNPATAPLALITLICGAIIGVGVAYLDYLAARSTYNAVWTREKYFLLWAGAQY